MDVISLTKKLISFNTINPPGNEAPMAEFIGDILKGIGFVVNYSGFGKDRLHLIAEKGIPEGGKPLVLSGHFDTVPLGVKEWKTDPLNSEIKGDKIYGRGSSDMKSGLAAMIKAVSDVPDYRMPDNGIRIIFTSGEELGCQGVQELVNNYKNLGAASAVIIGEPTGNMPATGHKGAIYLDAVASGKTAHSSMPDLGVNAIYKAAKAITKIENFQFNTGKDNLLGYPTINVGKINGGLNLNSVPDHAEFTIDIRTTTLVDHKKLVSRLSSELGKDITLKKVVDLKPVHTSEEDPFVKFVYKACREEGDLDPRTMALPYLTEGSVLQNYYNKAPTIILGPGQADMAHQTDEFCYIYKIRQAASIYNNIIVNWRN